MRKIVFMFPGQGAQYAGMGKDFSENIPECKAMFETASEASGLDVEALCFTENEQLSITEYTQIAMLAVEAAILKAVTLKGIQPDLTAGLSLGEYGALLASGVMQPEDAFYTVRQRGIFMQEAMPVGGAMTAVLGLEAAAVEEICAQTQGQVSVANYNCPGQVSISGEEAAVRTAEGRLLEAGAKRCVPLKVSGPFHSPLLAGAGERLRQVLQQIPVGTPQIPYLANVTADYVTGAAQVKDLLIKQVASPVRWQQSVERMLADGADTFIEIGPGRTLTGFVRKLSRDVTAFNVEKLEDLEKLDAVL